MSVLELRSVTAGYGETEILLEAAKQGEYALKYAASGGKADREAELEIVDEEFMDGEFMPVGNRKGWWQKDTATLKHAVPNHKAVSNSEAGCIRTVACGAKAQGGS